MPKHKEDGYNDSGGNGEADDRRCGRGVLAVGGVAFVNIYVGFVLSQVSDNGRQNGVLRFTKTGPNDFKGDLPCFSTSQMLSAALNFGLHVTLLVSSFALTADG